nr:helix-turn-helix transcriptional regulator [Aromatoleum toluvorans]
MRELRMHHSMRQADLAVQMGYEQSYLSALEVGTKGPPTIEFVAKLIQVFDLDAGEQAALQAAVRESQRKYVVPNTASVELFKMMHELWEVFETLQPVQIKLMRDVIALGGQLAPPSHPVCGRGHRKHKEGAQM